MIKTNKLGHFNRQMTEYFGPGALTHTDFVSSPDMFALEHLFVFLKRDVEISFCISSNQI